MSSTSKLTVLFHQSDHNVLYVTLVDYFPNQSQFLILKISIGEVKGKESQITDDFQYKNFEFEETIGVLRYHKSKKNRQCNGQRTKR